MSLYVALFHVLENVKNEKRVFKLADLLVLALMSQEGSYKNGSLLYFSAGINVLHLHYIIILLFL